MKKEQPVTAGRVVRASVLPFFALFVFPVFAWWFTAHAEGRYDQEFLDQIRTSIARDGSIPASQRPVAIAFYEGFPPSSACASDDPRDTEYRKGIGDACDDYRQFRIARYVAVGTIGLGVIAVLIALGCAVASFLSRSAQYASFVFGWHALRALGALIVTLQAALLVWLSFWMTAVWTNKFFVKLIFAAGLLAAVAVFSIIKSVFAKMPRHVDVDGIKLDEARAPELFARIRALCATLGTAPPEHVVAGIDDSFFVIEGEVRCAGVTLEGRTLFVSLALLRILAREEADAILAHEMAHFSGGDTEFSRKLAPAMSRFSHYLDVLRENPLSLSVFWFLRAYRSLFELSFGKSRREREFAADATSARLVSPDAAARALVRTSAYSAYRTRVERSLFEHDARHESLALADRIGVGFLDYARTPDLETDLLHAVTPHPFDSHPLLAARIAHLGVVMEPATYTAIIAAPVTESWCASISESEALEAQQWRAYEQRFHAAHEYALAHRYGPSTPEERALVEKLFPARTFGNSIHLDCDVISGAKLAEPIRLRDIKKAVIKYEVLRLSLEGDGTFKIARGIALGKLGADQQPFLNAFSEYWNRARSAAKYQAEKATPPASS